MIIKEAIWRVGLQPATATFLSFAGFVFGCFLCLDFLVFKCNAQPKRIPLGKQIQHFIGAFYMHTTFSIRFGFMLFVPCIRPCYLLYLGLLVPCLFNKLDIISIIASRLGGNVPSKLTELVRAQSSVLSRLKN